MSNFKNMILVVFFLTWSQLSFGSAGAPMLTDDPGTPGNKKWEINLAVTTEKNSDETHWEAPLIDLNYGIGDRIELKYEIPFVITDKDGGSSQTGFDQSTAGVKYRFLDKEKSGISMSIYPQITFSPPVGSHLKYETSESRSEYLLPIQLEEEAKGFEFNQELGLKVLQGNKNQFIYGMATSYALREGLEVLAELHGASTHDFSDAELAVNVGGQFEINKSHSLLFSVGKTLKEFESAPRHVLAYLGIQFKI